MSHRTLYVTHERGYLLLIDPHTHTVSTSFHAQFRVSSTYFFCPETRNLSRRRVGHSWQRFILPRQHAPGIEKYFFLSAFCALDQKPYLVSISAPFEQAFSMSLILNFSALCLTCRDFTGAMKTEVCWLELLGMTLSTPTVFCLSFLIFCDCVHGLSC